MIFCKKCGSILKPAETKKGKVMKCFNCNFTSSDNDVKLTEQVVHKKIEVIEEKAEVYSKTKEKCPKCGHEESYYWLVQTRAGDEAETKFHKCCKCEHTWRDYD